MSRFLLLLLALLQPRVARAFCSITQDPPPQPCNASDPTGPLCCAGGGPPSLDGSSCVPRPVNASRGEAAPHPYTGAVPNQCPQWDSVCCSDTQMQDFAVDVLGVYAEFGDIGDGGCPACYQNCASAHARALSARTTYTCAHTFMLPPHTHTPPLLLFARTVVNFWCQFTCSPNQASFVQPKGYVKVVDPVSGSSVIVLHAAANVSRDYACGTFESCASTDKVVEYPPLQSCEGFFSYMATIESVEDSSMLIDLNYTEPSGDSGALAISGPAYDCCSFNLSTAPPAPLQPLPPNPPGAPNSTCPCTTCKAMCPGGGGCKGGSECTCPYTPAALWG